LSKRALRLSPHTRSYLTESSSPTLLSTLATIFDSRFDGRTIGIGTASSASASASAPLTDIGIGSSQTSSAALKNNKSSSARL
jgi:hypothetical protein